MGLEVSLLKTPESKDVISTAFLPYTHLSDSISICNLAQHSRDTCFKASSIFSLTEEGKTPTNVVVVNTASKAGILVSVKPSLLEAARAADNSSKAGFVRSTEHFQVSKVFYLVHSPERNGIGFSDLFFCDGELRWRKFPV